MNNGIINPLKGLNYGVVGNGISAALISHEGNVDFLCLPHFNSHGVFASLLDKEKGGTFKIIVSSDYSISQRYLRNTNILVTEYRSAEGNFNVIDLMPRHKTPDGHHCPSELIRYIKYKGGKPRFRVMYSPQLGFGQHPTHNESKKKFIKSYTETGTYESIYLYSSIDHQKILNSEEILLEKDEYFDISYNQKILNVCMDSIYLEYYKTKVYWLDWANRTVSFKKYNDEIIRSALVLKLLTFQKTGAIIAAVTTSLPETVGEERNWDYRFCWIRDASMIIQVLFQLRHYDVAQRFLQFIINAIPYKDEKVQIMYGIRGEKQLTEKSLDWLAGYKDSKPVRIGNGAYHQKQNDIYGVLLDVIYRNFKYFGTQVENAEDLWTIARSLVRTVSKNWMKEDMGIWEFRSQKRHFVFSKVLCWVAIDRGAKIAELLDMKEYYKEWNLLADQIKEDVLQNGWNENLQSFTQAYENEVLDAANLMMAPYGFIDPKDPKYVKTVIQTEKRLCRNGLMFRYKNKDDFGMPKSSFTVCTFWLIKALHQIGEKEKAQKYFDQILQESNHLGLYSEDIDFETKELLGNFPQGYSHLALIDTAITLMDNELSAEETMLDNLERTQTTTDILEDIDKEYE
ncbi:glycoside hydrolase family 15 protein [Spirochaeta cellobiosiphila]|uniref:glycoside hydrolase family 15 protein n=1 Tax=Spirochaeta cellobiosiphila TaxID=504483 RepID=UPI000406BF6E|nr:glycoside hydrolase family 15 protein [Spirochaeta cellobiosiphila]